MSTLKNDVLAMTKELVGQNVETFSADNVKTEEALRNALIAANGGSTTINPLTAHLNVELFQIIPELVTVIVNEGLQGDEFWNQFVDYKNIAEGDQNEFYTEDQDNFVVSEIGKGNLGIRRQRLGSGAKYTIPTVPYAIAVFEHFSRLMNGRADWSTLTARLSKSVQTKRYEAIYKVFSGITETTPGMYDKVVYTGSYDEDKLLDVIEHVQADNFGAQPKILGTRRALRQLKMDVVAHSAEEDMYNMGYYGKFNGITTFVLSTRYKTGTHEFIIPNDELWVIAGQEKFIKFITEGQAIMSNVNPLDNYDLTQEYKYVDMWGVAAILSHAIGHITLTAKTGD